MSAGVIVATILYQVDVWRASRAAGEILINKHTASPRLSRAFAAESFAWRPQHRKQKFQLRKLKIGKVAKKRKEIVNRLWAAE